MFKTYLDIKSNKKSFKLCLKLIWILKDMSHE